MPSKIDFCLIHMTPPHSGRLSISAMHFPPSCPYFGDNNKGVVTKQCNYRQEVRTTKIAHLSQSSSLITFIGYDWQFIAFHLLINATIIQWPNSVLSHFPTTDYITVVSLRTKNGTKCQEKESGVHPTRGHDEHKEMAYLDVCVDDRRHHNKACKKFRSH